MTHSPADLLGPYKSRVAEAARDLLRASRAAGIAFEIPGTVPPAVIVLGEEAELGKLLRTTSREPMLGGRRAGDVPVPELTFDEPEEQARASNPAWAITDAIRAAERIKASPSWPGLPQPVQSEVQVVLDVLERVAQPNTDAPAGLTIDTPEFRAIVDRLLQGEVLPARADLIAHIDAQLAAKEPAPATQQGAGLDADEMTRLRRLIHALGMDGSTNASDDQVRGLLFTALGQAAGKIERAATQQAEPEGEAPQAVAMEPLAYITKRGAVYAGKGRPENGDRALFLSSIAFALPEMQSEDGYATDCNKGYSIGWNACREKVAEINLLPLHPATQQAEPVACVICGSEEPRTGTCGSDDPRALCKLVAPVSASPAAPTAQPLIGKLMDEISQLPHLFPDGCKEPGALLRQSDVWRALVAASKAGAAPTAVAEPTDQHIPRNFTTHRAAWREALEIARDASFGDGAAYWEHEIKAYDRAFARLLDSPELTADRKSAPNSPAAGDPSLPYESVLNGFIGIMGVEDSGDLLDDSRKAIDKVNAMIAERASAPKASGATVPDAVRLAGALMANTMFNLAQCPGSTIDDKLSVSMKDMQRRWDVAIAAAPAAPEQTEKP